MNLTYEAFRASEGGSAGPTSPLSAPNREADTLVSAPRSAITEVETALPDVRVVRVEVDRTDLDAPTAA